MGDGPGSEPDPGIDLSQPMSIHLVGVGGAGISAIAVILASMGHRVSGVDVRPTPAWTALADAGVDVAVVPEADLFASGAGTDAAIVAHSTAYPPSDSDRQEASQRGARIVDRASILAAVCATRRTVAVSGTHGKTSTTAMLATLLAGVGADPSYLVGAVPAGLGRAAHWGGPAGSFVVEADESDGSFGHLDAHIAVVTNIDEDHLDFWGSIEAIEAAFDDFVRAAGASVVCLDDPSGAAESEARAAGVAARHGSVTVGAALDATYRIHDIEVERLTTRFGLVLDGTELGPVTIGTPGRHHARNAAVAIATGAVLGVPAADGAAAVSAYTGVARRFEVVGEVAGVVVVDDYAHNPGKVRALVSSAAEAGWDRVVVVFQPHRYSRTVDQGEDLGAALADADVVLVTEVYGAGEAPRPGVTGRLVFDAAVVVRPGRPTFWVDDLDGALAWASTELRSGDLVLTVGAGDISGLGSRILAARGGGAAS